MSAASVATPLTTTYIQSPARFTAGAAREQIRRSAGFTLGKNPAPASYYREESNYGVTELEGRPPVVHDTQANPLSLSHMQNPYSEQIRALAPGTMRYQSQAAAATIRAQQQQQQQALGSPVKKGARVSSNSRTSAGFPLALTAAQVAETAARKAAQQEQWEHQQMETFERAKQRAIEEDQQRKFSASGSAIINHTSSNNSTGVLPPSSPSVARAAKLSQAARHARESRDHKISYRDRALPPTPDFAEDPLTAGASEHTGIYPGPLNRAPAYQPGQVEFDTEAAAPEGTHERALQKLRVNPLLDPNFQGHLDAAGLGYGVRHRDHFRYISHWSSNDKDLTQQMSYELAQSGRQLSGYRSKLGPEYGYREEVKGIGLGHEHPYWNRAVSVRRPEDVLADYGGDRARVEKFFNQKRELN